MLRIWFGYDDIYRASIWPDLRDTIQIALLRTLTSLKSDPSNDIHVHADVLHFYECQSKSKIISHCRRRVASLGLPRFNEERKMYSSCWVTDSIL